MWHHWHHWHSWHHWHPLLRGRGFYHWHWNRVCQYRRPSRLLWFTIGAGSAWLWSYHHKAHLQAHNARHWGHCVRAPVQVPSNFPSTPSQSSIPLISESQKPQKDEHSTETDSSTTQVDMMRRWAAAKQMEKELFDRDKDVLLNIAKQAQDAMVELSESTLDSVLKSLENLKAKIAEHRVQRDKQQKELERQLEADKKRTPSRWL